MTCLKTAKWLLIFLTCSKPIKWLLTCSKSENDYYIFDLFKVSKMTIKKEQPSKKQPSIHCLKYNITISKKITIIQCQILTPTLTVSQCQILTLTLTLVQCLWIQASLSSLFCTWILLNKLVDNSFFLFS